MKNYDDLQRFKEKTQTLDIAFKDMSGQTQEAAEQSKWALIRQLANDEHQHALGGGQRIDLPQPQPVRSDAFSATPPALAPRQPALSAQPATAARSSILDSLAGTAPSAKVTAETGASSLFPPPSLKPAESVVTLRPAVQSVVAESPAATLTAPANRTGSGGFGALFRSHDNEPVTLPKETLLKPLLEKIALCR